MFDILIKLYWQHHTKCQLYHLTNLVFSKLSGVSSEAISQYWRSCVPGVCLSVLPRWRLGTIFGESAATLAVFAQALTARRHQHVTLSTFYQPDFGRTTPADLPLSKSPRHRRICRQTWNQHESNSSWEPPVPGWTSDQRVGRNRVHFVVPTTF